MGDSAEGAEYMIESGAYNRSLTGNKPSASLNSVGWHLKLWEGRSVTQENREA